MVVFDTHCDTPSQIYRLRDLSLDNRRGHVDFPKLLAGGVNAPFFAIYIPKEMDSEQAFDYAGKLISATKQAVEQNSSVARLATSPDQALQNSREGLISVFMGLENASPIGTDLSRLQWFHDQGIRYITLCHNADNAVCDSAAQGTTHNGLSALGRELVHKMNDMGVIIDCAHISDKSFWDVLECSTKPVVSTHSCCRALSAHRRNMTDDMIKAIAAGGGMISINFYPVFLDLSFGAVLDSPDLAWCDKAEEMFIKDPSNPQYRARWDEAQDRLQSLARPSFKLIADHIDHAVQLVGTDHVGIGSDFDGICVTPQGLDNVSQMPVLFDELAIRGYSQEDIRKIAGENFLRVMNLCGVS